MAFFTKPLGQEILEPEVLKADKANCIRFGPCGVGKKALYLNSFGIERHYYVPFSAVERVFKRIAMSKGGYTGKGIFAAIPYLVVVYDNGKEKQCQFKHEENVDQMLENIGRQHPDIPQVSEAVEKKRAEREAREAAKPKKTITLQAEKEIRRLEQARDFLEKRPALAEQLSRAAKARRVNERSNPAYRWVALAIVLMGAVAMIYGIWAIMTNAGFGLYFTLFGLAAVFLFAGANVLPTGKNNRKYVEQQWKNVCDEMEHYLKGYPAFPVPEYYAHPVTLTRMIRILEDGRVQTGQEALEALKAELKALNSSVRVDQEEYDEVMTIKPMFLVVNYR